MEMATVSSSFGLQSTTQAAYQHFKLQQARQNAARAERLANSLEVEAANAQREADRAQENANSLFVRSSQAQGDAGKARQGVEAARSVDGMRERLGSVLDRVSASVATGGGAEFASASERPAPVVNTSGQVTGTVVNTVA